MEISLLFVEKYSCPAHGEKDRPTLWTDFKPSPLSGGALPVGDGGSPFHFYQ